MGSTNKYATYKGEEERFIREGKVDDYYSGLPAKFVDEPRKYRSVVGWSGLGGAIGASLGGLGYTKNPRMGAVGGGVIGAAVGAADAYLHNNSGDVRKDNPAYATALAAYNAKKDTPEFKRQYFKEHELPWLENSEERYITYTTSTPKQVKELEHHFRNLTPEHRDLVLDSLYAYKANSLMHPRVQEAIRSYYHDGDEDDYLPGIDKPREKKASNIRGKARSYANLAVPAVAVGASLGAYGIQQLFNKEKKASLYQLHKEAREANNKENLAVAGAAAGFMAGGASMDSVYQIANKRLGVNKHLAGAERAVTGYNVSNLRFNLNAAIANESVNRARKAQLAGNNTAVEFNLRTGEHAKRMAEQAVKHKAKYLNLVDRRTEAAKKLLSYSKMISRATPLGVATIGAGVGLGVGSLLDRE